MSGDSLYRIRAAGISYQMIRAREQHAKQQRRKHGPAYEQSIDREGEFYDMLDSIATASVASEFDETQAEAIVVEQRQPYAPRDAATRWDDA